MLNDYILVDFSFFALKQRNNETMKQKKLGMVIPNPFINDHINADGTTRVNKTLSEVPEHAVVNLADGSDDEARHRQRHACNQHKSGRPDFEVCNESVHSLMFKICEICEICGSLIKNPLRAAPEEVKIIEKAYMSVGLC